LNFAHEFPPIKEMLTHEHKLRGREDSLTLQESVFIRGEVFQSAYIRENPQ
jgi:hypothetical protein